MNSAVRAARRLYTVSTILLTLLSTLFAIALGGCVAGVIVEHPTSDKWFFAGGALGVVLSWLSIMLLCLGAQAIAEHIEYQDSR